MWNFIPHHFISPKLVETICMVINSIQRIKIFINKNSNFQKNLELSNG